MSVQTYTVKPLAWASLTDEGDYWRAETVFGPVEVYRSNAGGWHWFRQSDEDYPADAMLPCDSAEDGKWQAEAYYLSRLLPALEAR